MKDEKGTWKVTKGANCQIRLLIEPSQQFKDWQAANPIIEDLPARDPLAEIDDLKLKLKDKGIDV